MHSSRERDQSIERLLRQSRQALQDAGATDSCLDAETLAAWVDGGLSGAALAMAETHVADCARCQSLVGALARINSAAPPAEPERAARGWLAWLVPLTAAAVAVAVWIAVPHNEPERDARLSQTTEVQGQSDQAKAKVQEAPAGGSVAERPQSTLVGDNAEKDNPAKKEVAGSIQLEAQMRRDAASSEATGLNKQQEASGAIAPSASAPQAPAAEAAAVARTPPSGNALDSLRRAETVGIEIVSPDPAIRWRIAGSGVQRSTDGGANWEATSTGISTELTAGAAPSPLVCWVAGRGGVVLVSTDGRAWRRVAFPEMTDLSGVRARDARAAQVSTADGRTFSTTDAGATWVPRPLQDF